MKEFRHGNDDFEWEFKDGLRNGKGKKTFFHDRGKIIYSLKTKVNGRMGDLGVE